MIQRFPGAFVRNTAGAPRPDRRTRFPFKQHFASEWLSNGEKKGDIQKRTATAKDEKNVNEADDADARNNAH